MNCHLRDLQDFDVFGSVQKFLTDSHDSHFKHITRVGSCFIPDKPILIELIIFLIAAGDSSTT